MRKTQVSGKVYLVGIGPGSPENMTPRAVCALNDASVIIGQKACVGLITGFIRAKDIIAEDMSPVERTKIAVEQALSGKDIAIVTTGDPGIYAIASTFFGYLIKKDIRIPVEVIPGVAAVNVAAALLGSPLGGDFAVISLADMATPWSNIKKRLESAASGGFVITLYNPKGKAGNRRIKEAVAILKRYYKVATPVGIVTDAAGETEEVQITTLGEVLHYNISTQTILIIGNAETCVFDGRMITPRAYKEGVGY
ncbi:MAG: precorrin-3B C(17)-methyltransferase [Dehalococcoidales bacterium]|nr:precorrin-3B C(17)-methyltransferase [Dehalococcoidales bacterium]